jgi:predicted membrane-bound spermidine synthase
MSRFGVITPVLSIVLSVFMGGLAVGSVAAGRWIGPLTSRSGVSAIVYYAIVESLIGLGALSVPPLLAGGEALLLVAGSMDSVPYLIASAALIAVVLFPWCALMGATTPVMMAFLQPTTTASFSYLYTANVIGAVVGVLVTAGALIELLGFTRTMLVAVGLNLVIAALSLRLLPRASAAPSPAARRDAPMERQPPALPMSRERWLVPLILFATGFIAMGLEVIWTRAFTPILRTTIYAFASILAVYLVATWLGSAGYRLDRARGRIWPSDFVLAAAAASVSLPVLADSSAGGVWRRVGILASIVPFCLLLGYLTPQLIDRYSQGAPRRAGAVYAVNVIGCVLGPLWASYGLLPRYSPWFALALCAVPLLLLAVAAARPPQPVRMVVMRGLVAGLISLTLVTTFDTPGPLESPKGWRLLRDHTATVLADPHQGRLYVNGVAMTELTPVTKAMAHWPLACMDRAPRPALVICFGMGTTYRSLMSWGIRVTGVELVPSVPKVFDLYYPDARQLLQDPRGRLVIDDGRRFLQRSDERFDVITIDPPPPVEAAASSLLYSVEFYELAKRRLNPDGVLQQWFPGGETRILRAVARSLWEVFPHVVVYRSLEGWGFHFLASQRPVRIPTPEAFIDRLPPAARRDLVEWDARHDLDAVVRRVLAARVDPAELLLGEERAVIRDDRPYNEYYVLRRAWAQREGS